MGVIIPGGNFNPAALSADDLYILIQNPPGFIAGVPTDVIGLVGSASWGPVNRPVHMGNAYDALQAFGAIGAPALSDPYDLATDLALGFGQAGAGAGNLEGWAVRVTDGTDVAAAGSIAGAATSASITATVVGPVATDTVRLAFTSSAIAGSPVNIDYTVPASPSPTATTVAAAMVALINANAALAAVGIYAANLAGVISIYQPTALSPQASVARTVTGSVAVTMGTGAAVTAGLAISAIYSGVVGNGLVANVQAGSATATWTTILAIPSLGITEIYPNLPTAGFYAALKAAIAGGMSGVRGPSQIAAAGAVNAAVGAPAVQTNTTSGGTDGRAGIVTATLLGSDTAVPKTGLYALRALQPAIGIAWIVGSTDPVLPASLVPFGQTEGALMLQAFPTGTTTAQAVALVASQAQHNPCFVYAKDWLYFFDPINNVTRLVNPVAVIGATTATYAPSVNPGNKPVQLVLGTERNNPLTGNLQPYSQSEIGQLAAAGVMFISNPIPAGTQWGIREGQTTSLDAVTAGVEWWRMTVFLARSFNGTMGKYVDQLQSQQPNDPLRNAVRHDLNSFLQTLVGANGQLGLIDDYSVVCSFSQSGAPGNGVNTPTSVAQHYLYVLVRVRYLSTVRFFILALQGGTTVVTVGSGPGQQLQ